MNDRSLNRFDAALRALGRIPQLRFTALELMPDELRDQTLAAFDPPTGAMPSPKVAMTAAIDYLRQRGVRLFASAGETLDDAVAWLRQVVRDVTRERRAGFLSQATYGASAPRVPLELPWLPPRPGQTGASVEVHEAHWVAPDRLRLLILVDRPEAEQLGRRPMCAVELGYGDDRRGSSVTFEPSEELVQPAGKLLRFDVPFTAVAAQQSASGADGPARTPWREERIDPMAIARVILFPAPLRDWSV